MNDKGNPDKSASSRDPESAMANVLRAENEAREAIEACTVSAEQVIGVARQRVRRIAERTDSRIGTVHSRCATALAAQVDALLRAEGDTGGGQPDTLREEVLAAAVERLARQLSGDSDSSP